MNVNEQAGALSHTCVSLEETCATRFCGSLIDGDYSPITTEGQVARRKICAVCAGPESDAVLALKECVLNFPYCAFSFVVVIKIVHLNIKQYSRLVH